MTEHKRLSIIWTSLLPVMRVITKSKFNFTTDCKDPDGPYIVVSNHVTDWDPIFVGLGFKKQMYFLASEHIMRQGFISKVLNWLMAPITRQKGGSAAGAVKAMLRVVKDGGNVAFFPEGNRTWNGETQPFPPSTGKLIRTSGASLITYKITGGYFSSPRWSGNSCRRGKMHGEIVNIYTPEQLRQMTPAQINDAIAADIYVNACQDQRRRPVSYRGKNLAEHMETYLYICPKCGEMHNLESSGNTFRCLKCGTTTNISITGRFASNGFPFDNIPDWGEWQDYQLSKLCRDAGDSPIFSDDNLSLYAVSSAKSSELIAQGSITLYKDHIELPGDITIPVNEITGMSLRGATDLYIGTANGSNFEVKAQNILCTKKYLDACMKLGSPITYGI